MKKENRHFVAVKTVMNIKPSLVRNDTLAGKEYLVVPMVMLVEGVHEGSEGPYLYTNSEIGKRVEVWNRKPVVVYHPSTPTACTKEVLNTRWIGDIMNAKWDKKGKRLLAEAWLDEERTGKVDNRILEAIENEETLELSTGLFADSDEVPGDWNGEEYNGTLSNYGPDHLAVLPDQIGACSVKDGAGFYRNKEGEEVGLPPQWQKWLWSHFNELSQNTIREQLSKAIAKKGEYRYVEDVFDEYFIWSVEGGQMYQQDYKVVKDVVSVIGVPITVRREIVYKPISNESIQNIIRKEDDGWYVYSEDGKKTLGGPYKTKAKAEERLRQVEYFKKRKQKATKNKGDKKMTKEEMIANLIAAKNQWEKDDEEYLNTLGEERLAQMVEAQNEVKPKEKPATPVAKEKEPEDVKPQNKKEEQESVKPLNEEQYLAQMPASIRNRMERWERIENEEKDRLIAEIQKSPKNTFTPEWLKEQDLEMLQNLANLAAEPVENDQPTIHRFNYGLKAGGNQQDGAKDVPVLNCPGDVKKVETKKTA